MRLIRPLILPTLVAVLSAPPVPAALGGDAATVQADGVHLKGAVRAAASSPGITMHVITTTYGTSVREFAGADGKVFAVAWDGPFMPDLHQVLGSYYPRFVQAAAAASGSHRHLAVSEPDLVVQIHGRMRAYAGRAWVPSMVPQQFSVDEVR